MSESLEQNFWQSAHPVNTCHVLKVPSKNTRFHKCIEKIMEKEKVFSVKCFGFGKIVDFHKDSVLSAVTYITPEL